MVWAFTCCAYYIRRVYAHFLSRKKQTERIMRKSVLYSFLCLFVVSLLCSCDDELFVKKNTKWNVTLNKEDKKPYGTYLAYQSLKYYFPNAKVDAVSRWFRYTDIDNSMKYNYDGASLLVMVGLDFYISNK